MGGRIPSRERASGQGSTFRFTLRVAGRRPRRPHAASRRRRPQLARPARAGRGRQRHQPPHPRGNARPLGMQPTRDGVGRREALRAGSRARASRSRWCCSTSHMPEMDGFTLAERIRRADAGGATLMICRRPFGARRPRCAAAAVGIAAYLTKPVKPSALARRDRDGSLGRDALRLERQRPRRRHDPRWRPSPAAHPAGRGQRGQPEAGRRACWRSGLPVDVAATAARRSTPSSGSRSTWS